MARIEHYQAPEGLAAGNGYSHAVAAAGRVVVIAAQVAMDEQGELVGEDDPWVQTERVFENLRLALSAAGATFGNVIKLGVFATDISILPVVRVVRDRYVDTPQTVYRYNDGAIYQMDPKTQVITAIIQLLAQGR